MCLKVLIPVTQVTRTSHGLTVRPEHVLQPRANKTNNTPGKEKKRKLFIFNCASDTGYLASHSKGVLYYVAGVIAPLNGIHKNKS